MVQTTRANVKRRSILLEVLGNNFLLRPYVWSELTELHIKQVSVGLAVASGVSHRRGAIIPTPRQQGVDEEETDTGSPRWGWARRLKRVFALAMARCPCCQQGSLGKAGGFGGRERNVLMECTP